jgi:hypothetical protein
MNYKLWSDQEIEILKEKCLTGNYSYAIIGQLLNRDSVSCQNKAKQLKIKNSFKSAKKYTVNEYFWKPNPVSCYWAGFSAADASINKHSLNCYNYRLEIANCDINHLQQFKKDCSFNGPIKTTLRSNKFLHSRVVVCEPQWVVDLQKYYNIIPNKTLRLAPPNLENEYLKFCYLIGYIDGDGCIYFNKKRNVLIIKIISSSQEIISWCHNLIYSKFEKNTIKNKKNNHRLSTHGYPTLDVNGLRAAVLLDYLIKFDVPKLNRKWNQPKINLYIEKMKNLYPSFFIE